MTVEEALALVWERSARSSQAKVAKQIGVAPSTVTMWKAGTDPTGDSRESLLVWAERIAAQNAPPPADYWRGVLYACEAMAETTHRLLREAREADAVALDAKAKALIPPVPTGAGPAAAKTSPPRPRRASG